ncbi:hypothetical protein B0H12DRAFT_1175183 [Mycena haematopus]|nr:hypothetical protein B0H12DRAFT_1175183 [Mycena haematopus]
MLSSLRARLRQTRPFSFSTAAVVRNEPTPMAQLADVLHKQAVQTPLADMGKVKSQAQSTNRPIHEYKPFRGSFIRPYDLSLEGRSFKDRPLGRPPQIAPSTRDARKKDVFYQLNIDPLKLAQHPAILTPFVSELAMIYPRRTTGLTTKSQRRVAKAIRRAKMMGVIPLYSRYRKF